MAAGDRPDAIGHGDDGEAERAGDAQKIDRRWPRPHAPDHRRSATEEHQGESTDEFSDLLVHSHPTQCPRPTRRTALIATASVSEKGLPLPRATAKAASSTRAPLLSCRPRLYKRRPFK